MFLSYSVNRILLDALGLGSGVYRAVCCANDLVTDSWQEGFSNGHDKNIQTIMFQKQVLCVIMYKVFIPFSLVQRVLCHEQKVLAIC